MHRFECALFGAPEQSYRQRTNGRSGGRNQLLFLGCEVIFHKGLSVRFDLLEIAAYRGLQKHRSLAVAAQ